MAINLVGIELEGFFENIPSEGDFHEDGSVEISGHSDGGCDGDCRDNCMCHENCECEECLVCDGCDYSCNDCSCDSCMICDGCDNHYEECDCNKADDSCKKIECGSGDPCDDCIELFNDNQEFHYDCHVVCNANRQCDLDGSCGCECECECGCESDNTGEIVSPPMKKALIKKWVKTCYPDDHNSTCGIHVHVSFTSNIDYMNLMSQEFYDYFLKKMETWGKRNHINEGSRFWKRLQGENSYCKRVFAPKGQKNGNADRYTHLNYCFHEENRKTIECRLLPVFDKVELAQSAILEIVNTMQNYIRSMPSRQIEIEVVV